MLPIQQQFDHYSQLVNSFDGPIERQETLLEVRSTIAAVDAERLRQLNQEKFCAAMAECQNVLGNCLDIALSAHNDPLPYQWRQDVQVAWRDFKRHVDDIGSIRLEATLNKSRLVAQCFQDRADQRTVLFAESKPLVACLRGLLNKPAELESAVWGVRAGESMTAGTPPTLALLILDTFGCSSGYYCSLLGRDASIPEPAPASNIEQLPELFAFNKAREKLYWETPWLRLLSPRQLRIAISDRVQGHAELLRVFDAHAVNLSLLYLGTRSWRSGDTLIARFATDRHRFEVELFGPQSDLSNLDGRNVNKLLDLIDFAYQSDRFDDRLSFAQAAVGLIAAPGEDRRITATELLARVTRIHEAADWNWRSFCEERIGKYYEDANEVEKDVRAATEQFDTTTMKLIEDMSKTFLSSVGAFITAYIAAGLKKESSAIAFQIVLGGYLIYLALVAGWMNLHFVHDRFRSVQRTFGAARNRHVDVLGETRVAQLIGDSVRAAETRFWKWFGVTIGIYALFGILIITLIISAPRLLF